MCREEGEGKKAGETMRDMQTNIVDTEINTPWQLSVTRFKRSSDHVYKRGTWECVILGLL